MKKQTLSKGMALFLAAMLLCSGTACKPEEAPPEEIVPPPVVEKPVEQTPSREPSEEQAVQVEMPDLGVKISDLKAKNNDCIGWLKIPDTEVDAAVMYSDIVDFYHRKNELKEYSWTGCYYADYECSFGATSDDLMRSTVIYGHNVDTNDNKDGVRFSQLFHFTDPDWAKEHPYIYFSTPEEDMLWEIFACAYTTDFNYIQVLKDRKKSSTEQITEAQMMNIVNEARERSEYDYPDVEVTGNDKILTLSTCSYKYGRRDDVRYIIMAKLVTEDDALVEQANIRINEDKKEVK